MHQHPKCDYCLQPNESLGTVRVGQQVVGDICVICTPHVIAHIVEMQKPEARAYYSELQRQHEISKRA